MEEIPDYQAAFIQNRSCDDHMFTFTIRRILEEQWRKGRMTYILSLDLEKAFDKVNLIALVNALKSINIPHFLINRIIESSLNEVTCIKWFGQLTRKVKKNRGIKKGCPLSPRLFTIVLHVVLAKVQNIVKKFKLKQNNSLKLPMVLAFADDIILIGENKNTIGEIISNLILLLEDVGLSLNIKKM